MKIIFFKKLARQYLSKCRAWPPDRHGQMLFNFKGFSAAVIQESVKRKLTLFRSPVTCVLVRPCPLNACLFLDKGQVQWKRREQLRENLQMGLVLLEPDL